MTYAGVDHDDGYYRQRAEDRLGEYAAELGRVRTELERTESDLAIATQEAVAARFALSEARHALVVTGYYTPEEAAAEPLGELITRLVGSKDAEVRRLREENERLDSGHMYWAGYGHGRMGGCPDDTLGPEWARGYEVGDDDRRRQQSQAAEVQGELDETRAALAAEREKREAVEARVAAVEALLPNTDEEFPIFPSQLRAALGVDPSDYLLIPRSALSGDTGGEE